MTHSKLFYLSILSTCLLNGYNVSSVMPFGKTAPEISAAIKSFAIKKISLAQALNTHFAQQEEEILNALRIKYKIATQDWNTMQQDFEKLIAQDLLFKPHIGAPAHKPSDHPIIKRARELMIRFGLNPQAVSIIDKPIEEIAYIMVRLDNNNKVARRLCLNIDELSLLPEDEYSAIIRHELMHLWYSDTIRQLFIKRLFATKFPSQNIFESEPLITDYLKNYEFRADVMATVHSTSALQGLISWFNKSLWEDKDSKGRYPLFAQRIETLKNIYHYLDLEKKHTSIAA